MILLLLACADKPRCDPGYIRDAGCPCTTEVWSLTSRNYSACRPDQTARIEWEPSAVAARDENEDRVGGVLVCECKP